MTRWRRVDNREAWDIFRKYKAETDHVECRTNRHTVRATLRDQEGKGKVILVGIGPRTMEWEMELFVPVEVEESGIKVNR